jgi:ABC-type multidrug transport system fused ATPase/permease subunit
MIKSLFKNMKDGLSFQFKYTAYTLKRWPFIVIIYMFLIGFLGMLEPIEVFAQQIIINYISQQGIVNVNLFYSFMFFFFVSALFIFQQYASPIAQSIVGLKVASWINIKIYNNLQKKPLSYFDDADNLVKIDRAKQTVYHISSGPAVLMYNLSYFIALGIATIKLVQYPLILLLFWTSGLVSGVLSLNQKQESENLNKDREIDVKKLLYLQELQQNRDLALENRVNKYNHVFKKEWNELNKSLFKEKQSLAQKHRMQQMYSTFIQGIVTVAVFIILVVQISEKQINLGTFAMITGMGAIISKYIGYIFNAFHKSVESGVYIDDINEILEDKSQNINLSYQKLTKELALDTPFLAFNNVSFGYKAGQTVLKNITFSLKNNEIIALVGSNGSGKTTLSKLALGLYEPQKGEVLINGQDMSNIEKSDINCITSVVFQDYIKYEFSLRENIGFGDLQILNNDNELKKAVVAGGADGILNKKNISFDTILGKQFDEEGVDLSGGEWQRIAISRGFAGNHNFIVFDEPTAAIDPLSEIKLFEYVKNHLNKKSAIIVSHRVGICQLADKIIFLKNGVIEEIGTHKELYNNKSCYYEFFNEQAQWYDMEDAYDEV